MNKVTTAKRLTKAFVPVILLMGLLGTSIGLTYAIYSDSSSASNRIQSGTLKIGLTQVSSQTAELDDKGYIVTGTEDTTEVNLLSSQANYPLFDVSTAVPGVWYQKTIKVDGTYSDVAFDYTFKIVNLVATDAEDIALSEQIEISVTSSTSVTTTFMLNEYASNTISLGTIAASGSDTFTVKAAFVNDSANNNAQSAEVTFDIQITATQHVDTN